MSRVVTKGGGREGYLVSIVRRDDVSINGDSGFGEELAESGELGVRLGISSRGTFLSEFGSGLHFDGGAAAAAISDNEGRGLPRLSEKLGDRFEIAENWVWA